MRRVLELAGEIDETGLRNGEAPMDRLRGSCPADYYCYNSDKWQRERLSGRAVPNDKSVEVKSDREGAL
jgi:hypothetical protein